MGLNTTATIECHNNDCEHKWQYEMMARWHSLHGLRCDFNDGCRSCFLANFGHNCNEMRNKQKERFEYLAGANEDLLYHSFANSRC